MARKNSGRPKAGRRPAASESARRREPASPAAERARPQSPLAGGDLLGALTDNRERTVQLYRLLGEHEQQVKQLLVALDGHERGLAGLLRGVADIVDTFDRLLALGPDVDVESYRASVAKVSGVLQNVLADNGVELIGAPGEIAAPGTHLVVDERGDRADEDAVLEVLKRGLRYRGKLLRPASVIVSSGKADDVAVSDVVGAGSGPDEEEE
jgi:molecular chaperone GrpE